VSQNSHSHFLTTAIKSVGDLVVAFTALRCEMRNAKLVFIYYDIFQSNTFFSDENSINFIRRTLHKKTVVNLLTSCLQSLFHNVTD